MVFLSPNPGQPWATLQGVPRQATILLYRLLLSHTGSFHRVIADVLRQRATPPPSPRGEDSASELTARQVLRDPYLPPRGVRRALRSWFESVRCAYAGKHTQLRQGSFGVATIRYLTDIASSRQPPTGVTGRAREHTGKRDGV
jgi:hypothetical protein